MRLRDFPNAAIHPLSPAWVFQRINAHVFIATVPGDTELIHSRRPYTGATTPPQICLITLL